jgi:uncharacterized protein YjdB
MKFRKHIFSSILVLLVVGLFACSGVFAAQQSGGDGASETSANTQVTTQSTDTQGNTTNSDQYQNDQTADQTQQQKTPSIVYKAHVQNLGTQKEVSDGQLAGTTGKGLRMEAFQAYLKDAPNSSLSYTAHVQNDGWQKFVSDKETAGTTGKGLRMEAIKIQLNGDLASQYDVVYRVHIQNYGWLNWARNGEPAGSVGKALRIEAMQIMLVKKGEPPSNTPVSDASTTDQAFIYDAVKYQAHVQNIGTQDWVSDGELAGMTGRSLRVEGLSLKLADSQYSGVSGGISYRAHVQNDGWQDWKKDGEFAGTQGRGLRLEAIQINLTGDMASQYDVYYSCHVQNFGWLAWAKDGETAGTEHLGFRVEGIRVMLVKKGAAAPSNDGRDAHADITADLLKSNIGVQYQTHVQNIGWQDWSKDGETSGAPGQFLRVEAYRVGVNDQLTNNSYISYHSRLKNMGVTQNWADSRDANAMSGTTGENQRVEAIQMKLGGYASNAMDVWYRVYVQGYGWLDWAKDGQWAGMSNGGLRVEAIQIELRTQLEGAPGPTARPSIYINTDQVNWTERNLVVDIAESQLGTHEGTNNYTKYGVWYAGIVHDKSFEHGAWCAMFASWCGAQAGVPSSIYYYHAYTPFGVQWYQNHNCWQWKNYTPRPGDLVYYDWQKDGVVDHVGVVVNNHNGMITTVEGNYKDAVNSRYISSKADAIFGYGVPRY